MGDGHRGDEAPEVRAAGGLVWRRGDDGTVEVVVVHRPRYDDWSLPKGKLDGGEGWEDAAVREVLEETGLSVVVGDELPEVRYRDRKDRPKVVRYWAMEAAGGAFEPNDEVDELRWLAPGAAADLLSYPHDVELLAHLPRP